MSALNMLHDLRTDCISVIHNEEIASYLSFVEEVYRKNGGIKGQRAPLKTKTAVRIRNRMVSDLLEGAVIPPVVIGVVVSDEDFARVQNVSTDEEIMAILNGAEPSNVSIIDGMQRTTALLEAIELGADPNRQIRLEVWFAKNVNSLIYRMLVLNTGQVPWDVKRQLETVYDPILREIEQKVPNIKIYLVDDSERRKGSGEYRASNLIELFFAFTSRKTNLDIKEKVAEDFARMDATEALGDFENLGHFVSIVQGFVALDKALGKAVPEEEGRNNYRFKSGKDIFTSAPATIGFVAAASVFISGLPGMEIPKEQVRQNLEKLQNMISTFCERIEALEPAEVNKFMDFATLNQRLSIRSGKVGEYEREAFFKAFKTLFESGDKFASMQPAWMAW